jgi:phytoene dehydrogenase-like protein
VATILIVGAGHNGLVAGAMLSREGHDVTVLEARPVPGGTLAVEAFHPGYRSPLQSGAGGSLLPAVARAIGLDGQRARRPSPVTVLGSDGTALAVETDHELTPIGGALGERDRARFPEFTRTVGRLARVLAPLLTASPPSIGSPALADLMTLAATGRRFRALGRRDSYRLLQWAPMPIADLTADWFDDHRLRAAVAARGIFGRMAGPRSAGTSIELLLHTARTGWVVAGSADAGSPGDDPARALVRAAERSGARLRTDARVSQVLVEDGRAVGARLESGEELQADLVVSNADPKRTLLSLVDAQWLSPELVGDVQQIRSEGVVAKVHLALAALPRFAALAHLPQPEQARLLAGRVQIGATIDELERAYDAAKYGGFSERPYIELTVPSLGDTGLAPAGHHVLSIHAQFAPRELRIASAGGVERSTERPWASAREAFARTVIDRLEEHAPGLGSSVVGQQVLTPEDLERDYGLTGGHMHHGEHAIDQLFVMRPVYGWANYRTPVRGLYLCGAGTHPGGGVHGACGFNAARAILRDMAAGVA